MVGLQGLSDLQTFVEVILEQGVEGDLMETGVWQGGSCMLMAAVLKVLQYVICLPDKVLQYFICLTDGCGLAGVR
jgi:hypothetical protein